MTARLLSLNVGGPREVEWEGKTVRTAIWKVPVEGLADDEVCVGDRYRIGAALFEVTQPRVTC
jgi:MOSC domain-containing protein YiiM